METKLKRILPKVQKPARYVGGEYGQIIKNKEDVRVRVAFCFPDTYEIGMSNVGMRILYGLMNEMEGVWCERVFAPWGDMEDELRNAHIPLYALESQEPVKNFDMVAFTLGYEMSYTNMLNMLRLAEIPLHAKDRLSLHGIVFAGGVCAVNPEPLADFVDFFCIGEESIYAVLAGMLNVDNASIDDVIRIREKQFASMEKMMALAKTDEVLAEQIKTTYKTDNMLVWILNRLLNAPHPQFAKLRENPKYMEMLNKWTR